MATDTRTTVSARLALFAALALPGAAGVPGCQHDRGRDAAGAHGERFRADGEVRPVDRFVHVQSAAAARTDATLNALHFDGRGGLNSLGRQKLDLMLHDDAATPLVVYLDLSRAPSPSASPALASADAYHESVRVHLADRGLDDSQVDLRDGPNLSNLHPARDGLRGLTLHGDPTNDPAAGAAQKTSGPGGK